MLKLGDVVCSLGDGKIVVEGMCCCDVWLSGGGGGHRVMGEGMVVWCGVVEFSSICKYGDGGGRDPALTNFYFLSFNYFLILENKNDDFDVDFPLKKLNFELKNMIYKGEKVFFKQTLGEQNGSNSKYSRITI